MSNDKASKEIIKDLLSDINILQDKINDLTITNKTLKLYQVENEKLKKILLGDFERLLLNFNIHEYEFPNIFSFVKYYKGFAKPPHE